MIEKSSLFKTIALFPFVILSNIKDGIRWYNAKKIEWFENQLKKSKERRYKKIENQIISKATLSWDKLKQHDKRITQNTNKIILSIREDGSWGLVDKNGLPFNGKE